MELAGSSGPFSEPLLSPRALPRGPPAAGVSSPQAASPRTVAALRTSSLTSPRGAAAGEMLSATRDAAGEMLSATGEAGERSGSIHDLRERPASSESASESTASPPRNRSGQSTSEASSSSRSSRRPRSDIVPEPEPNDAQVDDDFSPERSLAPVEVQLEPRETPETQLEPRETLETLKPPARLDERSRQKRQLGRSFASAAQTLQHHLLMCLKLLGTMLEQYIDRRRQLSAQGRAKARKSGVSGGSQPSPRLPPSALAINAEPPGLAWRPPSSLDTSSSLSLLRNMDKNGNHFLLFVAMLDAMLQGSFTATEKAQTGCFEEFPETRGCQQDEFISFDGTLTTVYEDEDFETKRKRAEVPQESSVSADELHQLEAEYQQCKSSISTLQHRLGDDSARILQLEEARRELRADLEQRQGADVPVAAEVIPDTPQAIEALGIFAQRLDENGAVVAEDELQKLMAFIRKLKIEAQDLRTVTAEADGQHDGAVAVTQSWLKERLELEKLLGLGPDADVLGAIKGLVARRSELDKVVLPRPEVSSRASPPAIVPRAKSAAALPAQPASASTSARPLGAANVRRGSGLIPGRREAVPVQRGRRGGPTGTPSPPGPPLRSRSGASAPTDEEKLRELSDRFVEVRQQYRDLVTENKKLRDVVSLSPSLPPTLLHSQGSRSEASLPTVAQANGMAMEPSPAPQARSSSLHSCGTVSTDRSPTPSSGSGRDRSRDGSLSQSDRSPDSWRSSGRDESPLADGMFLDGYVAGGDGQLCRPGRGNQHAFVVAGANGSAELPPATVISRPRSPMASVNRQTPADPRLGLANTVAVSAPGSNAAGSSATVAPRRGREGDLHPSQRGSGRHPHRMAVSQPQQFGKPMRRPTEGNTVQGRTLVRPDPNVEALVSVFRGGRHQDGEQQVAAPTTESGVPSPPVANVLAPSPPGAQTRGLMLSGRVQGVPQRPGLRPSGSDMRGHSVEREEDEVVEKSRPTPATPHLMSPSMSSSRSSPVCHAEIRQLPNSNGAQSPNAPLVWPAVAAVPVSAMAPSMLLRGGVHSSSARSLPTARTPSPAIERVAHSASARCLHPRSASASHSPEPQSRSRLASHSPAPSDYSMSSMSSVSSARRAPSPGEVLRLQPPSVQMINASATGAPRNARATWPTPAMHAQVSRGVVAAVPVNGVYRAPSNVANYGMRRR